MRAWSISDALGPGWIAWMEAVPPPARGASCNHARPCRYYRCRWHLAINWVCGEPEIVWPEASVEQLPHTCLFDLIDDNTTAAELADSGDAGMTAEAIAEVDGTSKAHTMIVLTRAARHYRHEVAKLHVRERFGNAK